MSSASPDLSAVPTNTETGIKELLADPEYMAAMLETTIRRQNIDDDVKEEIRSRVCEFLDTYVIVGYDIAGRFVRISHAPTEKDRASLTNAIDKAKYMADEDYDLDVAEDHDDGFGDGDDEVD
tara:strand:+ start:13147 stop:13515 length:369 start_codon:yes stop_codon:yes gene_type:complete